MRTPFDRGLLSLLLALAFLATSLTACNPFKRDPASPSVIVQSTQTVTIGATPAPSPGPSATPVAGFCAQPSEPVASLRFGVRSGSCAVEAARGCAVLALPAGQVAQLDISPLNADGQLVACHGTLTLAAGPLAQVTLRSGGGTDFLPQLQGGLPGTGRLDAEVNGTRGFLQIEVR